jgi:hypothetical protein
MTAFYFDTSAIVKRYDPRELGAGWIRSLFSTPQADFHLFSQLVTVEVTSAFYRKRRDGTFNESELQLILDAFHLDILNDYWFEPVSDSIIQQAADLIRHHPLRAYDAVQLATAIYIDNRLQAESGITLLFLSADDQLIEAARRKGLAADNPNSH